ncbi:MAG: hypothetical protein WDM77_01640 [Steroidobacteraceae bacterium]
MPATRPLPPGIRHLLLDRDGVLNQEAPGHGYILRAADFKWLPGSREALVLLSNAGLRISIVTNQSAVGRGLMSRAQLDQVFDACAIRPQRPAGKSVRCIFVPMHPMRTATAASLRRPF